MMKIPSYPGLLLLLVTLSGCNLYGGLSSPSNDEQHLDAARACLDRNDFPCALEHYQALSDSYADIRINETSLARLGEARVFSFSDLISALGTSLGNGRTLSSMAELIARRNVATAANRLLIQETYASNGTISNANPKLRAFSQFLSSITMFNTVLAQAVGADGVLSASDIVTDPTACAGDALQCVATAGFPDGGTTPDLTAPGDWDGTASLNMLWSALDTAEQRIGEFTGNQTGILSSINELLTQAPPGAGSGLKRQQLILILGLE